MTKCACCLRWCVLFGVMLFTSIISASADSYDNEVRIGVIVPLSGPMASHGIEVRNAMGLALDEYSKSSTKYRYVLLFEDSELSSKKIASATSHLINNKKVDVIVSMWMPSAMIVSSLTERAKILHYAMTWDREHAKQNRYVLSHQVTVDDIVRKTLELLKSEGKKRIAVTTMEDDGFVLGSPLFAKWAAEYGVSLIAQEYFSPDERDFRALIERVQSRSPDAYVIWAVAPSLDLFARQLRERVPRAFITGYLDYANDKRLFYGAPYISEMHSSAKFRNKYIQKYVGEPFSKGPNAYDILSLVITAFESSPSKKLSAAELKSYCIHSGIHDGAVGKFSISAEGNSSYEPIVRVVK